MNPFDKPHALNPFQDGTGSAKAGLKNAMEAGGVRVAEGDPQTLGEAFARGSGEAAAMAPVAAGGLAALGTRTGAVGNAAKEAWRSIATKAGFATETVAGGMSESGAYLTEEAGGGELAQNLARVAAPLSVPAATGAARAAGGIVEKTPVAGTVVRMGRDAIKSVAPMTETGARSVARDELARRSGGFSRMEELGQRIDPGDPYMRTGAQQTGDPEMMGLEVSVKGARPVVREALDVREAGSRAAIREDVRGDGRVADAQAFLAKRIADITDQMQSRVERVVSDAQRISARQGEAENSARTVEAVKGELDAALAQEQLMWQSVPRDAVVGTSNAKAVARDIVEMTPRAQQEDIPAKIRALLVSDNGFSDQETVAELHGLYSKLREVARAAMAGNNQQKNTARIANNVADAILEDLDAVDAATDVGKAISDARVFSRSLHETFDRGAVGRILKRTLDGDETMTPEAALRKTVGVRGPEGGSAAKSIMEAGRLSGNTPTAEAEVKDFISGRFANQLFDADGAFRSKAAKSWIRENMDVLNQFPDLKKRFWGAIRSQEAAEGFAARARLREKLVESGPIASFAAERPDNAITTILQARDPAQAARRVAASARKDKSGQALAGVKASFSDRLVSEATNADGVLSGRGLKNLLAERDMKSAMNAIFSAEEMSRLNRIAEAAARMDVKPSGDGEIINAPVNQLLLRVVQIAAAQKGGAMGASGNMGGSLQTANIMQRTATRMMENLTNRAAKEMLVEAVQDPALMRALMLDETVKPPKWARDKIAPYLAAAATSQE